MPDSRHTPRIPEIPGYPLQHREQELWLRDVVAKLCGLEHQRFPGAQPVSFGSKDLAKLESQDFWVAEKSDGIRVLLFVHTDLQTKDQAVYLIDRHNSYRLVEGLVFPHYENPANPLRNTLVDGELVIDLDPKTKQETLRYLAFDCLVVDDRNIMSKNLEKRYGHLQEWFYKPYSKMMKEYPNMAHQAPFDIKVKPVKLSYHAEEVFNIDIPNLQHGNDGLIYTSVNTPYLPGTDRNILKWKPPSENSIDFKLVLRFPSLPAQPRNPDYFAKPVFELHVYCGDRSGIPQYEMYDVLRVEDHEWERMKQSSEQLDDRIVEVHWDTENECWRMMRFRDDKPNGNHKSVVDNIIKSIADGVEKEQLLERSSSIRIAWKTRQGQPVTGQPPPPSRTTQPLKPFPAPQPLSRPTSRPTSSHAPASNNYQIPPAKPQYGHLASSPWSKVSGPTSIAGMLR